MRDSHISVSTTSETGVDTWYPSAIGNNGCIGIGAHTCAKGSLALFAVSAPTICHVERQDYAIALLQKCDSSSQFFHDPHVLICGRTSERFILMDRFPYLVPEDQAGSTFSSCSPLVHMPAAIFLSLIPIGKLKNISQIRATDCRCGDFDDHIVWMLELRQWSVFDRDLEWPVVMQRFHGRRLGHFGLLVMGKSICSGTK